MPAGWGSVGLMDGKPYPLLQVTNLPPGADISSIDSAGRGRLEVHRGRATTTLISPPSERFLIRVECEGYEPWQRGVKAKRGATVKVEMVRFHAPEYVGLEYVGTHDGKRLYTGPEDVAHEVWVKGQTFVVMGAALASSDSRKWLREHDQPDILLTPECLKAMLGWARVWDELPPSKAHAGYVRCPCSKDEPVFEPEGECHVCGLRLAGKAEEGTSDAGTQEPDRRQTAAGPSADPALVTEAAQRFVGELDADFRERIVGAFKPAVDAITEAAPKVYALIKRHKAWGDMMTTRPEKTGPILICGEPGHVRLMLERLSDDRGEAMGQLGAAAHECDDNMMTPEAGDAMGERLDVLAYQLRLTRRAIEVGWELEPYLQFVRDAHEAIGIEREWQAAKVHPASVTERLARWRD